MFQSSRTMLLERIYLSAILMVYIPAFAMRNVNTTWSFWRSVEKRSRKQVLSIILSVIIYTALLIRSSVPVSDWLLDIAISGYSGLKYAGLIFISSGLVVGVLASLFPDFIWHRRTKPNQADSNRIHLTSRNPYIFSNHLSILGYLFIFPSLLLCAMYLILLVIYHQTICEESEYMESVHSSAFKRFMKQTKHYQNLR